MLQVRARKQQPRRVRQERMDDLIVMDLPALRKTQPIYYHRPRFLQQPMPNGYKGYMINNNKEKRLALKMSVLNDSKAQLSVKQYKRESHKYQILGKV